MHGPWPDHSLVCFSWASRKGPQPPQIDLWGLPRPPLPPAQALGAILCHRRVLSRWGPGPSSHPKVPEQLQAPCQLSPVGVLANQPQREAEASDPSDTTAGDPGHSTSCDFHRRSVTRPARGGWLDRPGSFLSSLLTLHHIHFRGRRSAPPYV